MAEMPLTQKKLARYIILVIIIFVIFYIMVKKIMGGMAGTPLG